ncbi:MAG TPA: hypothetical protein VNR61_10000 [Niallia sp.]|nr:hypothetical protein [Niallia sp.]
MLLNCKNEQLVKFSKGTYNKQVFIQEVKDRWELTDKQIRMTFLIADLAENAEGVFSIAHSTFVNMFEQRFKMKISLSTVRRFFELLSKLELLSIHAAKRRNNQQSANIYIVELQIEDEQLDEQAYEQVTEQASGQHNIALKNTLNKDSNIPLNNCNCNYKESEINKFRVLLKEACNEFYTTFATGRYSKKQWNTLIDKFVNDSIDRKYYETVIQHRIKGFAYKCLEKIADNTDYKNSDDFKAYQESMFELANSPITNHQGSNPLFYDWLNS